MTIQLIHFVLDRDKFFVRTTEKTDDLHKAKIRALTLFAAHKLEKRLAFEELPVKLSDGSVVHYTLVYPNYKSIENSRVTLIADLRSMTGHEGFMLVNDDMSLGYLNQPQLIVFPATKEESEGFLSKWLSANLRFLNDHQTLQGNLCRYVREAS